MDKPENTEVNSPTSINDFNPLRNKLSPQQFEASVKFYEADHDLEASDRGEIAEGLRDIVLKTAFVGYGSAVAGFSLPTLYNRFQVAAGPQATRPLIYRPFLSFMIGLSSLMIMNQQSAKYSFNKKINSLLDTSKLRQLNVWKAMDYHQAALFYLYYRKTAENPSMIIPDPRTFTEKQLHEVHYNPNNTRVEKHDSNHQTTAPHWEEIRKQNGFVTSEPETEKETNNQLLSSAFSEHSPYSEDKAPEEPKKLSAWDAIRQKK